jgi:hypothetical protein
MQSKTITTANLPNHLIFLTGFTGNMWQDGKQQYNNGLKDNMWSEAISNTIMV